MGVSKRDVKTLLTLCVLVLATWILLLLSVVPVLLVVGMNKLVQRFTAAAGRFRGNQK